MKLVGRPLEKSKSVMKTTMNIVRAVSFKSLVATGLILAVAAPYVRIKHAQAEDFLNQINLQARNTSGATFYGSKKKLFIGQELSRNDVVEYLRSTNFAEAKDPSQSGAYVLQGNDTLLINPRLAEFQPVALRFKRNKIAGISVAATPLNPTSGEVTETTIEPEALGAFVMSIDGDDSSRMFVRRYTMQFTDFESSHLFFAVLASEDPYFMSHNGTRFDRILINLLPGHHGGGSSITAQVVKNAVSLDRSHTLTRKVDEIFLASALEQRMSKADILTLYVNDVFLGGGKGSPNIYGFLAASEEYFGKKSIGDCTLSEISTLVAMLPQPSYFLEKAKAGDYQLLTKWRDRVLERLNEYWPEKYPTSVIEAARTEQVRFVSKPYVEQPLDIVCRGFIDFSADQHPLVDLKGLSAIEYSGLHIYTSADTDLMREGQRILSTQIPAIERRFPPLKGGGCSGQDDRMLGAIVALDSQTGEVITMVGGAGGGDGVKYAKFALNAVDSPASTIKPFWFVKAIAEARLPNGDRFTAASIVDPTGASINGWQPTQGLGGAGRARLKLASSADDFAVYTFNLIGFNAGKRFFDAVMRNVSTEPGEQLAIGLGRGTEVASPLRLAKAYTVFGNNGEMSEASPISHVYSDGKEVEFKRPPTTHVADAGAAFITAQVLRSTLGYGPDGIKGTARSAFLRTGLSTERTEIAGKTGSGPSSVWMVSVSPRLVVAVMLTYQCHSVIKNSQEMYSRDTAALIWSEFIKSVHKYRPDLLSGEFTRPESVIEVNINPRNGCRSNGPGGIKEFFLKGTEPEPCSGR
jgi:membrane peptidoglycan carboxypeptidase